MRLATSETVNKMRILASLTVIVAMTCSQALAEGWPTWGGPPGGSKYSPLDQINRDNVKDLEIAWTYRTGDYEGPMARYGNSFGLQAVPILLPEEAGGHLVFCNPFWRVIALDPVTGELQWEMDPGVEKGLRDLQYKCRGVAQWHDTEAAPGSLCEYAIIQVTGDRRIFSMDARTGEACPDFGDNGELDVAPAIASVPRAHDVNAIRTYFPPAIVGGSIIIGSVVGTKFKDAHAPSGAVHAFDVRTGAFKWYWDPVPRNPGDLEAANWTPESLATTGGGNVWTYMTWDPERDLVFLPTSSVSPNYYGVNRPGDNRYANSTVALRGSTGEMVWHFQNIHHDIWDLDTAPEPMVIELDWEGERKTAVAQLTKQGLTFVFDIETGEPLWPVDELPVDTNGIEGEQVSPTQPYPVKPPPLAKFVTTVDDAWGYTFIDHAACKAIYDKYSHGTKWTPPSETGLIIQPGMVNNYGGGAYDPERNLLITNARRFSLYVGLPPADTVDEEDARSPMAGMPSGPAGIMKNTKHAMERGPDKVFSFPETSPYLPMFSPCTKPPWYVLVAMNLSTGEVEWEVPLGVLDKSLRLPLPLKFGAVGIGGPMITAGGIVFIGATADERFRAFDIDTGKEIWSDELPTSNMTNPMTYERNGRQFVVLAAGGHHIFYPQKVSDWLIAYSLPDYMERMRSQSE